MGKNSFGFISPSHTPYTSSSLVSGSSSVHRENRKFKKGGSKGHSLESSGMKCVFCDRDHWSDNCRIVSDRKDLLKKGNRFMCLKTDHISRNCQKAKPCFSVIVSVSTLPSALIKLALTTVRFQ